MNAIEVGSHHVGPGCRPFFIGEIGINHNGSPELARKLIDMAARIGIQAVKFQKRDFRSTITKAQLNMPYVNENSFGETYGAHKEALELNDGDLVALAAYARSKEMIFGCSAFDIKSYDFIEERIRPAFHKIASPQVVHHDLLRHVASYGKPIFVSTGMCSLDEVKSAVEIVLSVNERLVLFQCTSLYPVENEEANLRVIPEYARMFNVLVGYSSHDKTVVMPAAAVALGACAIEKHITLDRTMKGPDHTCSFEQRGLELAFKYSCSIQEAMGEKDKRILERERASRVKHLQSIVAAREIARGETIQETDIAYKSPGKGLLPYQKDLVIGRKANRAIHADELILEDDLTTEGCR